MLNVALCHFFSTRLCCCTAGVFGTLELYGTPPNVYHTKLAATAAAGSNTLTLSKAVDWKVSVASSYLHMGGRFLAARSQNRPDSEMIAVGRPSKRQKE